MSYKTKIAANYQSHDSGRTDLNFVNLDKSINALVGRRAALVDEIDRIDRALAILKDAPPASAAAVALPAPAAETSVAIQRLRPKRQLSEEHKRAMVEGRRKAKLAKEVAAGRALGPVDAPAISAPASETPRLVKRNDARSIDSRREFTIEPDVEAFEQVAH